MSSEQRFLIFLVALALILSAGFRLVHRADVTMAELEWSSKHQAPLDLARWSANTLRSAFSDKTERVLGFSQRLAEQGDEQSAIQLLTIAAKANPANVAILEALAGHHLSRRDLPNAAVALAQVSAQGLAYSENGTRLVASLAMQSGDLRRAEFTLGGILQRRPGDTETLVQMAHLRVMQGRFAEGSEVFRRLLAIDSKNEEARLQLARTLAWQVMRQARELTVGGLSQTNHD